MNKRTLLQLGIIVVMVSLFFSCSKESTTEPENGLPDCIIVQPSDGATLTLGNTLEISDIPISKVRSVFFGIHPMKHTANMRFAQRLWIIKMRPISHPPFASRYCTSTVCRNMLWMMVGKQPRLKMLK